MVSPIKWRTSDFIKQAVSAKHGLCHPDSRDAMTYVIQTVGMRWPMSPRQSGCDDLTKRSSLLCQLKRQGTLGIRHRWFRLVMTDIQSDEPCQLDPSYNHRVQLTISFYNHRVQLTISFYITDCIVNFEVYSFRSSISRTLHFRTLFFWEKKWNRIDCQLSEKRSKTHKRWNRTLLNWTKEDPKKWTVLWKWIERC